MTRSRVTHILKRWSDKRQDYALTVCGRIVQHSGMFLMNGSRKHNYLEWSDRADCQDCLKVAFKESTEQ